MKPLIFLAVLLLMLAGCDRDSLDDTLSDILYVQHKGARMPAYIYGNGSNKDFVIMVYGGPGGTGLEYRAGQFAETMEERYAMVYWDQRGQGMAQGRYNESDVTVAQMAEDLEKLILVIKAKYGADLNIFLMGHSWGGTLGTAFMINADYQSLVKGWMEVDGAHDIPRLNRSAIRMVHSIGNDQIGKGNSVDKWQELITWATGIDTNNITIAQSGEINGKAGEAEELLANDGVIQTNESDKLGGPFSPENPLTALLSGNATSDLLENEVEVLSMTEDLNKITVPCLFLWGRYDFVVSPQLGIDAFAEVSSTNKKLVIFEKSGHSPMDNEPELFLQEVDAFIQQNR